MSDTSAEHWKKVAKLAMERADAAEAQVETMRKLWHHATTGWPNSIPRDVDRAVRAVLDKKPDDLGT